MCVNQNVHYFCKKVQEMNDDDLVELDQTFVTLMFDGTECELKPDGKKIRLTYENKAEYLCLLKQFTFSEFMSAE